MKRFLGLIVVTAALGLSVFSQVFQKLAVAERPAAADPTPMDLAKAAIAAHGGDKLTHMKSLIVAGSADIAPSPSQIIPATFRLIIAGDRYVFELNNAISPLKQIFDGKQRYSSGYELPPMTSLGFPL